MTARIPIAPVKPQTVTARITRVADHGATWLFAMEAGLVAVAAGLDVVGVLVICFVGAVGGGIIRDLLIGATPPAAIADWRYAALVMVAAIMLWTLHALFMQVPATVVMALDAGGIALAAIAGTEKALDRAVHPLVAPFLGAVGATGGGVLRDIILNRVPRVLYTDIYATAAMLAAVIVVAGRLRGWPPRMTAIGAGLACFILRVLAYELEWHLPGFAPPPA